MIEETINSKIKLMEGGRIPEMQREGDACFDCYARLEQPLMIKVGERKLIPLGFALQLQPLTEAMIRPRSGLSKRGIDSCIGTIDSNYRGEVMACIVNNSNEDFVVYDSDRICQMAIRKYNDVFLCVVDKLDDSNRGKNGFGSTGIR